MQLHSPGKRQNFSKRRLWESSEPSAVPGGAALELGGTCDQSREWQEQGTAPDWHRGGLGGFWEEILHGGGAETLAVAAPGDGDAPSLPGGVQGQVKKALSKLG